MGCAAGMLGARNAPTEKAGFTPAFSLIHNLPVDYRLPSTALRRLYST